ncbi:MAG: HlyD family efflux transporter periplasmic adaptor subunit [Cyanobacteria bacterium J06621_8]
MKMLSKIVNLKQLFNRRHEAQESLTLPPKSDSQLLVKPQTSLAPVNRPHDLDGKMVQWSPAMQSLLDEPPSHLPLQMICGGVMFLISFSLWAYFGEVDQVGKAQGKLVPQGETYKIESVESAKVSYIGVQEGQEVVEGELIARLDSEQEAREVERLADLVDSYRQELNQKRYLLEKVEVESQTHRLIAQAEVRSQRAAIDSAIAESQMTQELLQKRQSELMAYAARQEKVQDLSALEQDKLKQINLEIFEHQRRIERLQPLLAAGAISQEALFQAQQAQRQSQQQLTDNKLQGISKISEQIFSSEQALRDMESRITESQGKLLAGQKKIEQLQAELERQQGTQRRIELEAQQKVEKFKMEIGQTEAKLVETENKLATAASLLKKRSLIAPVSGRVLAFNVMNTGKVVHSGETVAEIAPQDAPLILSAILPEQEAGFISIDMPVKVKFDAYSYQDYGVIGGKVLSISADTQTDEQLGVGYRIKIELERNYVMEDQQQIWFKPGQTATADIVIRRQRIISVLLDPIKKLQQDRIEL